MSVSNESKGQFIILCTQQACAVLQSGVAIAKDKIGLCGLKKKRTINARIVLSHELLREFWSLASPSFHFLQEKSKTKSSL